MFGNSLFSSLITADGGTTLTLFMIILTAVLILVRITGLNVIELSRKFIQIIMKLFGKFISKKEEDYHRDIEIGKLTEKRTKVKLYKFLSELIIDLGMIGSGITPYELFALTCILTALVVSVICRMLFGTLLMALPMIPIAIIAVFCIMYTKANVAHDARIEAVIEAENIICNNIKVGVVVAVKESLDVLPREVRTDFKDFIDNVEQKNYHIKTALQELSLRLGGVSDDFIKKCIVFEMEEEHGISGMFSDIVEINNINMEMRIEMKRQFEEVKMQFIMGAGMIFAFLAGVLVIFPNVREFYFHNFFGQLLIALDMLVMVLEFMYITFLRAKEL